ncbi:MAG: sulfatase-like hydrolase/transferase [Polyangiaceae bacterium]
MSSNEAAAPSKRTARSRPRVARRRRARLRTALALAIPTLLVLALELVRRPRHFLALDVAHAFGYVGSTLLSAATWVCLLAVGARQRGRLRWVARALFVFFFGLSLGVQGAYFGRYHTYCGVDSLLEYRPVFSTLTCGLPAFGAGLLAAAVPVALLAALATSVFASRVVRLRRRVLRLSPVPAAALLIGLFVLPSSYARWQASTPEHIYFNALAISFREKVPALRKVNISRTQRRHPIPVPALVSTKSAPPNILFLLQESVRYDAFCNGPDPKCERAGQASSRVARTRVPFEQLRAVDSSTVISMAVILTGLPPTESFSALHSAPTLWAFAKAAGYTTGYWTSQQVQLFGMRFMAQDEPLDRFVVSTHLEEAPDPDSGARDGALADRFIQDLPGLKEPFFAVVQLANVHSPYLVDPDDAPFKASKKLKKKRARYYNAIHASDVAMARILKSLEASDKAARTIVVFTSDHGESFGENDANGHTQSIYEAEVHVPGWIWAPGDALSPVERHNLSRSREEPVYHLDFGPTMLDLMGLWDAPALAPFKGKMLGYPLTRGKRTNEPVALTNCSWIWQCRVANYGAIQYPFKLTARAPDTQDQYRCYNLENDPEEETDLGEEACGELGPFARDLYRIMPNQIPENYDPPR